MTYNDKTESEVAVTTLLRSLDHNVNSKLVVSELEKHHEFPSLLAISDVLNWFQVENDAFQVPLEELESVPLPFIAHTKPGKDFVTVVEFSKNKVKLLGASGNPYYIDRDIFAQKYAGVVLIANSSEKQKTKFRGSWQQTINQYKYNLAGVGMLLCFISYITLFTDFFHLATTQILLFAAIKTLGLALSSLLLIQSVDKNNPLVQTVCGLSKNNDCNSILLSDAAIAFYGISWSEIGFFYFSGTWLLLLISHFSPALIFTLGILNILVLPYTIYSINYQARVAKQWCILCCGIQVILWLEFFSIFSDLNYSETTFDLTFFIKTLTILIAPLLGWTIVKPLIVKSNQINAVKQQLYKFKYNKELFDSLLREQPKYTMPSLNWSITLGNVEASTIITVVSNPFCPPCSRAHKELDEWLERMDNIQLRIVFTGKSTDKTIIDQITSHLMAITATGDERLIKKALSDWFGQKQKNYHDWAKLYSIKKNDSVNSAALENQRLWCETAEIKATPTFLINGYKLPAGYHISDIKYMLQ